MYQSVRRAGKRYIVSKLNGGTNTCPQDKSPISDSVSSIESSCKKNHLFGGLCQVNAPILSRSKLLDQYFINTLSCSINSRKCFPTPLLYSRHMHTLVSGTLLKLTEVEDTLRERNINYKKGFTGFIVSSMCCSGGEADTFIDQKTGDTTCLECTKKMCWKTFLQNNCIDDCTSKPSSEGSIITYTEQPEVSSDWLESSGFDSQSCLPENNLRLDTYLNYNVRMTRDHKLVFPYYDNTKKKLMKFVTISPRVSDENSVVEVMTDAANSTFLFGWNTIRSNDRTLILTTSELDAMSVWQVSRIPSLAISRNNSTLPPDILPFLEQFEKIIFWFNDSYRDRENLQNFAKKLNLRRCWKVTPIAAPSTLLEEHNNEQILTLLRTARRMTHERILTYKELRSELYNELINAKMNAGIPFTRFPALNEYLRGHRRGELTVFTGPTGSGKTTFLSELSLDLCLQGVKTLWGSFEIKNIRLLNTLMHQYAGFAIENHMDKFMKWSENFENLPMYFMSYYGAQSLQDVIETIEYAVYTHDIEHVIIDNLQFMTSTAFASSDDRFQVMDRAIAAFRRCASDLNIHVTVVVHPRKENDGESLQTASIYGSAKASQEADNVLILQTSDQLSMQITKNRFCGTVGVLPLSFHPDSLCLSGFHRNVDSEEEILPALRVRRPISNVKIFRKKDS